MNKLIRMYNQNREVKKNLKKYQRKFLVQRKNNITMKVNL